MMLVERCGAEVGDGDAAACVHHKQEDQVPPPRGQDVCEQLPLIDRDPGQVNFTPVHMQTHTDTVLSGNMKTHTHTQLTAVKLVCSQCSGVLQEIHGTDVRTHILHAYSRSQTLLRSSSIFGPEPRLQDV